MFLVIDNYDSFVHNLARYVALAGQEISVVRNDRISLEEINELNPSGIVLSPGPCSPAEAGICTRAVKQFGPRIPVLGVCLGHQCIGEAYGGRTVRAQEPFHGRSSLIEHDDSALFKSIPSPLKVGRYHSLVTELPAETPLRVTACTADNEIMAMQHTSFPVYGVQFHPESVLTDHGLLIIQNFIEISAQWHARRDKKRLRTAA